MKAAFGRNEIDSAENMTREVQRVFAVFPALGQVAILVFTYPVWWVQERRDVFRSIFFAQVLPSAVLYGLEEPVAASLAKKSGRGCTLVVDTGGSTVDIAVVLEVGQAVGVLSSTGLPIGGGAFTGQIAKHLNRCSADYTLSWSNCEP